MTAETCRLCLCGENLTNIFDIRDSVSLSTQVMSLARVKIYPDDGLPGQICSKCIEVLDICLNFINVCEKSDVKLREKVQQKAITKEENICKVEIKTHTTETAYCSDKKVINNAFKENNCNNYAKDQKVLHDNRGKGDLHWYLIDNDSEEVKTDIKKSQKQQCFTCGKVMSSRFRLKTHLRTHTGERPFQCPHCNKNFSLAQNLKVHLRIHTGEKPLTCNICGEKFAQSAGLVVHRRKHTGQKPYKCMLCPRSFRTVGHLQYHIRRHTGEKNFECDTCGRAFITRSDLKQHLTSHTGDKPHVCCVCGLRLTRASHLTRHIRYTHNEHKPFICTECPSKFNQKGDLEKHKKKHMTKIQIRDDK